MILSRPCAIAHKPTCIAAAVTRKSEDPPGQAGESFEKARSFLDQIRDGDRAPDRFYLGAIPGAAPGRYYANFDSIHTLALPDPDSAKAYRIATLEPDFQRDLHFRLFGAFARLGFDDHGWLTDQDLDWLLAIGEHEVAKKTTELAEVRAALASQHASGAVVAKAKEHEGRAKRRDALQAEINTLELKLQPYRAEHARRGQQPFA
ncbi:MAG TPA: hypothetical protein VHV55_14600 [Pirellulales bacterium]|nr:hypothetical protein [Pirellulales bacterium]